MRCYEMSSRSQALYHSANCLAHGTGTAHLNASTIVQGMVCCPTIAFAGIMKQGDGEGGVPEACGLHTD